MKNVDKIRLLIVGAGKAGQLIARDIKTNKKTGFDIIGFIDDSPAMQNKNIKNIPVLGKVDELPDLIEGNDIEEVLIAAPSSRGDLIRRVVDVTSRQKVGYKLIPRSSEVLAQDFAGNYEQYIRKVRVEDLLGGEISKDSQKNIIQSVAGRTILVTGAAGSIGSELSRQIAAYGPAKLVFYDWWENGMFTLRNQLLQKHDESSFEFIIGDVKDRKKLNQIMKLYKPSAVFHAAAYKHVPMMEANAAEAIKNNIIGTKTVGELAIKHGVEKFVLVSTDKAVNPTNIMGATKRAAEQIIHVLSKSQSKTIFCAVRFGNVINSNGSAIPIFQDQIAKGGPVTVTHKDITRFFMTIPEAVHLILKSWVMGENDDLFVLDMGESIKIYDLARTLISLEGYISDEEIKIMITGLRPGEKLYEEVLVKEEETQSTAVDKVFKTKNYVNFDMLVFLHDLQELIESLEFDSLNHSRIKTYMKKLVSTYSPSKNN